MENFHRMLYKSSTGKFKYYVKRIFDFWQFGVLVKWFVPNIWTKFENPFLLNRYVITFFSIKKISFKFFQKHKFFFHLQPTELQMKICFANLSTMLQHKVLQCKTLKKFGFVSGEENLFENVELKKTRLIVTLNSSNINPVLA